MLGQIAIEMTLTYRTLMWYGTQTGVMTDLANVRVKVHLRLDWFC